MILRKIRSVIAFQLFGLLAACGGGSGGSHGSSEGPNIQDVDISGTWLREVVTEKYKQTTGEYLESFYEFDNYILEETDDGVKYDACLRYGNRSLYGVKTAEHFYMNDGDSGFEMETSDRMVQHHTFVREDQPEFEYSSVESLERLSDDVELDSGYFSLSGGGVSVTESDHVCYIYSYSNVGVTQHLDIIIPYGEGSLTLNLGFYDDFQEGVYEYEELNEDLQVIWFFVTSWGDDLRDVVGSADIFPETARLEFTLVEEGFLEAEFSMATSDMTEYTGSFSVELPQ